MFATLVQHPHFFIPQPSFASSCDDLYHTSSNSFHIDSKESGNRLQDISNKIPTHDANTLAERGWSLYVMNMVRAPGNQFIFRKDNERAYQPYFGSSIKSQQKSTSLPEMQLEPFEALCRHLIVADLSDRVKKLPDLTVRLQIAKFTFLDKCSLLTNESASTFSRSNS